MDEKEYKSKDENNQKILSESSLNALMDSCKKTNDILPFLLQFDQYFSNSDIIREINKNSFDNIDDIYDLLQMYIINLKCLKELDFFKNSRQCLIKLLKIGEYNKYINFLFYIKLYQYYLKIKIRNIILLEYLVQYREKYPKERYIERIKTKKVNLLLENEKDNTQLEHYLYELMIKEYLTPKNIQYSELIENEQLELDSLDYFIEKDNIEWIKYYWKYIEKTAIYKEMGKEVFMDWIPYTYLKHKVEIEPIISEAYYIEDIRNDNDFIFNHVNKIKHIKVYKFGYSNSILKEIDFILNNINNRKLLIEKYDFSKLYNIHYYKTILNIDYYTINLFNSVSKNKLENKLINLERSLSSKKIQCPFRRKNKYYISEKYEIPFTKVNKLYQEDPDNYVIAFVSQIKYLVDLLCIKLKKEIEEKDIMYIDYLNTKNNDENNRSSYNNKDNNDNKNSNLKIQSISNANRQYSSIIDNLFETLYNNNNNNNNNNDDDDDNEEFDINSNINSIYKTLLRNDEFINFFVIEYIKFISLPRINHQLMKFNYNNKNINSELDNNINAKSSFLFQKKSMIENSLKIIILFFFNIKNKDNFLHLKSTINFLKEKLNFFRVKINSNDFFNILNSFESSKPISKILYIDNKNAYLYYDEIMNICKKLNIAKMKIDEKAYELKSINPRDINFYNLNFFYLDYSFLSNLYNLIVKKKEEENKSKECRENLYNVKNNLSLINHIFNNNINLFFSYIYNSFNDVFENDFVDNVNFSLISINNLLIDGFWDCFFQGMDCDLGDLDPDFDYSDYVDGIKDEEIEDFLQYLYKILNVKLYKTPHFFRNRIRFYKELIDESNGKSNYETFFKHLIIILQKFDDEYSDLFGDDHNKLRKSKSLDDISINLINEEEDVNKESHHNPITDKHDFINNNDIINLDNSKNYNELLNKKEFKDINENLELRRKLYIMHKIYTVNNMRTNFGIFVSEKVRHLYYERYLSTFIRKTIISQFNYIFLKNIRNDKNDKDKMEFIRKQLNKVNKNNKILSLNIDMEYTNSYINFLNYIVNFYDSGLTYDYEILNYKYIIEKNDTVDLYKLFSNFSNIKLTNKEWFEINNENKSFFLLTLGIYLLNADYSNSYLYNSMNNFNICWHEDIIKINENDVKIWLKWFNTSGDLYKYYEEEIKAKEQEIIENTRIIDNILQISLKNFMRFDSYTNINQLLLPSFFHYLNNNNIYNIQI